MHKINHMVVFLWEHAFAIFGNYRMRHYADIVASIKPGKNFIRIIKNHRKSRL